MMECRRQQGGKTSDFPECGDISETVERILAGVQPALQNFLAGIALGAYFTLGSHEDVSVWNGFPLSPQVALSICEVLDMPAPPRNGFRRNARQGRQNRPARGHNDRSIGLSRNSQRRQYHRTETISRDLVRLLRHGPRRNGPPFPSRLEDGASTSLAEILARATFRSGLGERDLENIVSPDDPARKLRFEVYNSPQASVA